MKKLKVGIINLSNKIVFLILMTFIAYSCKDSSTYQVTKKPDLSISKQSVLSKQDFIKCTNINDTSFSNGDYIKYIPVDNNHYTIEIKIEKVVDTLDFYLSCKTGNGMIPKLLLEKNFICFLQGSTSYRYLTLCSLNKDNKSIDIGKFTTAIDVSSERDGFVFIHEKKLFFYDRNKEKLLSREISSKSLKIIHSELLLEKNRILIKNEQGDIFRYSLKGFY